MTDRPLLPGPIKTRVVSDRLLYELAREYGTPLYLYDADTIRQRADDLRSFDVVRYAQKANNNLGILRLMGELDLQVDAVSAGEARRALLAGFEEGQIQLTADLFDRPMLDLLAKRDLRVNLGSADMIEQYAELRPDASVTLRINPGFGHGHDRKVSTGGAQSKHGIWHLDLPEVLERLATAGLTAAGVHIHIGSGSDLDHLAEVRNALALAARSVGGSLSTLSAGGGLPVPYRPDEPRFDVERFTAQWRETKTDLESELGKPLSLEVEPGRYLVAESGLLVCEVRATKTNGGLDYLLVDAGFDNLLRPAMYGSYHHISVVGRDHEATAPRLVAGPLCESADLFTQLPGGEPALRELPAAQTGDLLAVHDTGAYASSMASNYNTRARAAEVLIDGGSARLIRRRQSFEDLVQGELELL